MANVQTTETQGKPEFAHGKVFSDKENLLRAAAGDKTLSRTDLAVLVNVLYHLNRAHGFARPQCATLALECDADERSIGRSINKLHDAGYMRAERRRGGMKRGYQFYPSFAKGAAFAADLSAKFAAAMRGDEVDENVVSAMDENVVSAMDENVALTNSRPDTHVASATPDPTNPSQKVDENVVYNPSTDPTERRGSGKGDASAPTGLSLSLQPVRDVASQKAVKADCRDALKDLYASWPTYISPPDVDKALSKALAGGDSLDDIRAAMADYSVLYADPDCRSKTSLAKWIAERRYVVPARRNVAAPVQSLQPAKAIRQDGPIAPKAVPTSSPVGEADSDDCEGDDDDLPPAYYVARAKLNALEAAARLFLRHDGAFYLGDFVRRGPDFGVVSKPNAISVMRVYTQNGTAYNASEALTAEWSICSAEELWDAYPDLEELPALARRWVDEADLDKEEPRQWLRDVIPGYDDDSVSAEEFAAAVRAAAEAEAGRRHSAEADKLRRAEEARKERMAEADRLTAAHRAAMAARTPEQIEADRLEIEASLRDFMGPGSGFAEDDGEAAERAREAEALRVAETNKQRWAEVLRTNGEKLAAIRHGADLEVYEVEAEAEFDAERLEALEAGTLDIPVLDNAAMMAAYKAAAQAVRTAATRIASR